MRHQLGGVGWEAEGAGPQNEGTDPLGVMWRRWPGGRTGQMSDPALREAASTMKFFQFTVSPKEEESTCALGFLLGWRKKKIPKALELITAYNGCSCKHIRRR